MALKWLSGNKICIPYIIYFLKSLLSTFFHCILSSFFFVTQNLVLSKFINLFPFSICCIVKNMTCCNQNISAYTNPQIQVPLKHLGSHGDVNKDKQDFTAVFVNMHIKI